eukprot:688112-Amphidinium_carterae.1
MEDWLEEGEELVADQSMTPPLPPVRGASASASSASAPGALAHQHVGELEEVLAQVEARCALAITAQRETTARLAFRWCCKQQVTTQKLTCNASNLQKRQKDKRQILRRL